MLASRLETSGGYYGLVKRGDKQFPHRSFVRTANERESTRIKPLGYVWLSSFAHSGKRTIRVFAPSRLRASPALVAQSWLTRSRESANQAQPGADLVCTYSPIPNALRWAAVAFAKNTLTVTGGDAGTKNHEVRTVPMAAALSALLVRLQADRKPQPTDSIALTSDAKKCLQTACRRLAYPHFSHHDFRHFLATTCIESGVDIPTVSRWLGHKDGGALAMRVYGHLRQEHSLSNASFSETRKRAEVF